MWYLIPNQKETGMFSLGLCFSINKAFVVLICNKIISKVAGDGRWSEEGSALSVPENLTDIKQRDDKYTTTMASMFLVLNWSSQVMFG